MTDKFLAIVNPAAGGGRSAKLAGAQLRSLKARGLRVDAIGDLVHAQGAEIAPPLPGGAVRHDDPVHGVLPWQGGFVALLDVRRLCRLPLESEAA